ncbi:MAG TPA: four-carbon acid sugar kinase family protein [Anaerolineales bacterium]|nr:four-carbon acid sugar kinase family protein [Anaerolineales bacterium]
MNDRAALKMSFYGDDLTGSTDAMEALALAGVPTVLFLDPTGLEQAQAMFPHAQAIGLAGMSRTMTPAEMDAQLVPVFAALKKLGAPLTHYKVCSTFDSAPEIGSIGRAIEIGVQVFPAAMVPVIVGAPKLKRFVVFSNLFAALDEQTYRLDRHPVMRKHPITPMHESDLRLHLARQTQMGIDAIDVRQLDAGLPTVRRALQTLAEMGPKVVFFDALDHTHLRTIGQLLWELGSQRQTFVAGSSGVEFGLTAYWQSQNLTQPPARFRPAGRLEPIVVLSGSASPWTASQIEWALAHGFMGVKIDSPRLLDHQTQSQERQRVVEAACDQLRAGRSVLIYSALGPDDPQIRQALAQAQSEGTPTAVGKQLGAQQGEILSAVLAQSGLRRAAVAGGDTCGHVLRRLKIYVLEFIIPLGTAAPLCRARSYDPLYDGLEIALKGGQLGNLDYFGRVVQGE